MGNGLVTTRWCAITAGGDPGGRPACYAHHRPTRGPPAMPTIGLVNAGLPTIGLVNAGRIRP
ncbi:MAG: hypothetical protein MK177_03595 [Acidimicrobiales bacterium]|nr:hypothetical protein [Acidimicrobiales bacterium]